MKRKLEVSELIFKIISYTMLTVFALCCLYPFVYAVSAAISGQHAVDYSEIVLFPKDIQFEAFSQMFNDNMFWNAYPCRAGFGPSNRPASAHAFPGSPPR